MFMGEFITMEVLFIWNFNSTVLSTITCDHSLSDYSDQCFSTFFEARHISVKKLF